MAVSVTFSALNKKKLVNLTITTWSFKYDPPPLVRTLMYLLLDKEKILKKMTKKSSEFCLKITLGACRTETSRYRPV